MKVSLITLHYIRNYGSVLQTYATQSILERLGYSVEVVNYIRPNSRKESRLSRYKEAYKKAASYWHNPLMKCLFYAKCYLIDNRQDKLFQKFVDKYIHLSKPYESLQQLKDDPPVADLYCTGSDQMWNSTYNGGILPEYFLEYAPDNKIRFAFSSSFGKTDLSEEEKNQIKPFIMKYKAISVRESTGVSILNSIGYKNAVHLLDPTLVITHEEWIELLGIERNISYPYVLLYQLHPSAEMLRFAKKIADDTGCKLLKLTKIVKSIIGPGKMVYTKRVEDFLSLIENASYIVTDSFHGTAFSLNFEKQVFVFYPKRFSVRLQSILALTQHEHRAVIDNMNWRSVPNVDIAIVKSTLERERKKTLEFLRSVVE